MNRSFVLKKNHHDIYETNTTPDLDCHYIDSGSDINLSEQINRLKFNEHGISMNNIPETIGSESHIFSKSGIRYFQNICVNNKAQVNKHLFRYHHHSMFSNENIYGDIFEIDEIFGKKKYYNQIIIFEYVYGHRTQKYDMYVVWKDIIEPSELFVLKQVCQCILCKRSALKTFFYKPIDKIRRDHGCIKPFFVDNPSKHELIYTPYPRVVYDTRLFLYNKKQARI